MYSVREYPCGGGRKTLKSLKESTWNTIKSILKDWGLKEDTNYKINNLEGTLTFWNDSVIIMKEMADIPSDPNFERFGSSEYTIAMVDEVSEISERASRSTVLPSPLENP
ncbi:hypothetical protein NXX23_18745 [Bacteroides ovatus]|nr:hypothetical protein [Bacteroides ovatus]